MLCYLELSHLYEWDFSYDGVTFNPELSLGDNTDFNWFLDGNPVIGEVEPSTSVAGDYDVALRLTTELGLCTDLFFTTVIVQPIPDSDFTRSPAGSVCPDDLITFTNNSVQSPAVLAFGPVDYQLVIDDDIGSPTSFVPFPNPTLDLTLDNSTAGDVNYTLNLQATAAAPNNCFVLSTPINITVNPAFSSGFEDIAFDPFAPNCSPLTGTFDVDGATQALDVDSYTWTIFDATIPVTGFPQTKNNGAPNFHELSYQIDNNSQTGTNYRVLLEPVKAGLCIVDAEEFVRVNPVPSSDFTLAEITDECETKMLTFQANQPGLVDYDWTFTIPPDITDNDGDQIRVLWNRPDQGAGDLNIDANLNSTNAFDCQSSSVTTFNFIVESQ